YALYGASSFLAFVWPLLFGTLLAAFLALLIATPLALGVALVISHYAPRRLARPIGYLVDLLAAVPSVVYGLWGIGYLGSRLAPRPGRDHGRGDGAVRFRGRHLQPDQQRQPVDDRREHRPAVPRVHRAPGERPHRQRPGAVRDHLRGQLRGPRDRRPRKQGA